MFTEDFIKNYGAEGDAGYLLVVDIEYPKTFRMLHSDLPFLPEKMKINKCPKLVCNVSDKENYSNHIVALKQALNHSLVLKKVHSVISFRQEAWLKPYTVMLRLNAPLLLNAPLFRGFFNKRPSLLNAPSNRRPPKNSKN